MDLLELQKAGTPNLNRHPWEKARLKFALLFLKGKHSQHAIIDIGSGDAYIAKSVACMFPNVQVVAVDIHYSEAMVATLQELHIPNIKFVQKVTDVKSQAPVDTVLLMDVIEHIADPLAFLQEVKEVKGISPATQFIITVPAYQWLFSQHDMVLGHYKRYNRKELIQLLSAAHLQVWHSGYFFPSLLLIRAFQKLKVFPDSGGLHNWKGRKWSTQLLTLFFWTGFKISWYLSRFRIYLPGLTCYCICRPLPL